MDGKNAAKKDTVTEITPQSEDFSRWYLDVVRRAELADYTEVPRTILLSTHLVGEVSALLEEVVILDRGRLVTQAPVDTLRGRGASLVGPAAVVDELTAGLDVLAEQRLGEPRFVEAMAYVQGADLLAPPAAAGRAETVPRLADGQGQSACANMPRREAVNGARMADGYEYGADGTG